MKLGVPTLKYFAICGRGELARLICAAGELPFNDEPWTPTFDETGNFRAGYQAIGASLGFPGSFPILEQGDFALFQSNAIEAYLASIAPKFINLTPQEKAKDMMFSLIKEDTLQPCEKLLFKKISAEDLAAVMPKQYGTIEDLLPDSGFVNGLDHPTVADLAVVVVSTGCMPFQAACTMAGVAFDALKYPKMARVAREAMEYGPVANFLVASEVSISELSRSEDLKSSNISNFLLSLQHKTLKADPFNIMPAEYHK